MPDPRRILLIDDDADMRDVVQMSLELVGGHVVATAGSGQAGVESARAEPPDAILLDVMMPGLDGPATFARLQDHPETRHVPVVLLTAKVQEPDRRRFAVLGVAGVVTKPFDPLGLPAQIAEILGWDR